MNKEAKEIRRPVNNLRQDLIIAGLVVLLASLFISSMAFGFLLHYFAEWIQTGSQSNSTELVTTSSLSLNFTLQAWNNMSMDEIEFLLNKQMDQSLNKSFATLGYYRYSILDASCSSNASNYTECFFSTTIDFVQPLQFNPSLNQTYPNSLSYSSLQDFWNAGPLQNLSFVQNVSEFSLASVNKTNGNLYYGSVCTSDSQCDVGMWCAKDQRCRCLTGYATALSVDTGFFICVQAVLNYQDNCVNDTDCYSNSVCSQFVCVCKPGYQFRKGLCVQETLNASATISCITSSDCNSYSLLMKCQNSACVCNMGYHLDGVLCVKGQNQINTECLSQVECGLNSVCSQNNTCQCQSGFYSLNGYDCYAQTGLQVTSIYIQSIYQDALVPPDTFDQINYNVNNVYDQLIFNSTGVAVLTSYYYWITTRAHVYSGGDSQWYLNIEIGFVQPIELSSSLFQSLIGILTSQTQFQILTDMTSIDYENDMWANYFMQVYPTKATHFKQIGDWCQQSNDCADLNAHCDSVCTCNTYYTVGLDILNHQAICDYGKSLNQTCSGNDSIPCASGMSCSNISNTCTCSSGYRVHRSTCIPDQAYLNETTCSTDNDCPIYSKCVNSLCICNTNYVLVDGLCEYTYTPITEDESNVSCLGQSYCGQNAICNSLEHVCKCEANLTVIQPGKTNCG